MLRRIMVTVLVLAWGAVGRAEAQRSHFGLHGGYNLDFEEGLVGAQMHLPLTPAIELYPSFDYYLVDAGSLLAFNGDLKFRSPGVPLYFGGGVNILRASGGGSSSSDTGFDLFAGFETRYGSTHPYIEARGLFHDNSTLQLLFGINITLY